MNQTLYPDKPILMVDDEEFWLVSQEALLARHGQINNVVPCTDSSKVMEILAEQDFSLVLLDYGMPGLSGEELLTQIVMLYPQLPVVILTGYDQVDTAVRCMDLGACGYLVKTQGEVPLALNILDMLKLKSEASDKSNKYQLSHPELFTDIFAKSSAMKTACQRLDNAFNHKLPLLLVGEPGVGKRFFAKKLSSNQAFDWFEFDAARDGEVFLTDETWVKTRLADAKDGYIYLKNIDALNEENQLRLLKLLQQPLEVRFILTITTLNPETMDKIRDDLLHLLKTHMIEIPPLRERKEDLPELTRYLIQQAATEYCKKTPTPPAELDLLLQSYIFPGNVKELKKMVFEAVKAHKSRKMSMEIFKQSMAPSKKSRAPELQFSEVMPTIEEAVWMLIDEAERRSDGNQTIMADLLGISRQALNKRLNRRSKKS